MKKVSIVFMFLILVTAGCNRSQKGSSGDGAESRSLEIFSWWTAGGEGEGLEALVKVFQEKHPEVEIINAAVAGGAGSNAKAVLATRMQGGNPPDTFQVHAGHALIDTWVVSDFMEPVTFILKEMDWLNSYPQSVIDIISYRGEVYSIPVNIHRSNVVWYNVKIFEENSLEPPQTMDDFFKVAETLQTVGVVPLALGDTHIWTATHLLESAILAATGPDRYRSLWEGQLSWSDQDVQTGLTYFARMMEIVNSDHAAITDMDAIEYVAEGRAAMNVMGDWAAGYYMSQDYRQGEVWDWIPFPDTSDSFIMLSDSFGLPRNAPNREGVIQWLKMCASREGQDAFNPVKGSIPARIDGNRSLYNSYLNAAMDDFQTKEIVPSVAHGAAISESWLTRINDVVTVFVTSRDVKWATDEFQALSDRYAP